MSSEIILLPLDLEPQLMRVGGNLHANHPDLMVEEYIMKDVWCLHFYNYEGEIRINGLSYNIKPYSVSLTAPFSHVDFIFKKPNCYHISAFFKYPLKSKEGIPFPQMIYLKEELFQECYREIHRAAENCPLQMKRAQVAVWNILWTLSDSVGEEFYREWKDPLPLDRAVQYIEQNFAEKIRITQIAEHAGVSSTHLTRLFQKRFNTTVIAYLRNRRVFEAIYLLTHTKIPIKQVAGKIGIQDISHFYKTIQKEVNLTPLEIRNQSLQGGMFTYSPYLLNNALNKPLSLNYIPESPMP